MCEPLNCDIQNMTKTYTLSTVCQIPVLGHWQKEGIGAHPAPHRRNTGRVFSHDSHDAVFRTTANICISHDTVFRTTSQIARRIGSHDKNMILRFARRQYSHDNKNSKMHFSIIPLLVQSFTLSTFFQ